MALCEHCAQLHTQPDYPHPKLLADVEQQRASTGTLILPMIGTCSQCQSVWRFDGRVSTLLE